MITSSFFSTWTATRDYISEMESLGYRVRFEVDMRPNPKPYRVIVRAA